MNATEVVMPATQFKRRLGLIAVKIGSSFAHKLGIEMPLETPEYSTATKAVGAKSRTRVTPTTAHYAYGRNPIDGTRCPTKALPGATVYVEVQDLSRIEADEAKLVRWACNHHDCAGKRWATRDELVRDHGKNKDLVESAERDPHGHAHVYFGVLEVAGKDEVKDKAGKVIEPAMPPTIMIVSDEE